MCVELAAMVIARRAGADPECLTRDFIPIRASPSPERRAFLLDTSSSSAYLYYHRQRVQWIHHDARTRGTISLALGANIWEMHNHIRGNARRNAPRHVPISLIRTHASVAVTSLPQITAKSFGERAPCRGTCNLRDEFMSTGIIETMKNGGGKKELHKWGRVDEHGVNSGEGKSLGKTRDKKTLKQRVGQKGFFFPL